MSRSGITVLALHGFLGRPEDWEPLRRAMPWAGIDAIDVWPIAGGVFPGDPWTHVGQLLARQLGERARLSPPRPAVILAYSFGARLTLAVEALGQGALPVAGTCLVSCHPGLAPGDTDARSRRRAADERWARCFETEREEDIRQAWESQPVLAAVPASARRFEQVRPRPAASLPAPRDVLARAMRNFSLGGQPDFAPRLSRWRTPLLWVTGAEDGKFGDLARRLREEGARAEFAVCPEAGHRVPWDNPGAFARILRHWLAGACRIDLG